MSIQPVVYSTGGVTDEIMGMINPGYRVQALLQEQITDQIMRVVLTVGGILVSIWAVGLIARDTAPGMIAGAVRGVLEGEKSK